MPEFLESLNSATLLRSLQFLSLSQNQIRSTVPLSLGRLSALTSLDLSSNEFWGCACGSDDLLALENAKAPSGLWSPLKQLSTVSLANNQLSGTLPLSLLILPKLSVRCIISSTVHSCVRVSREGPCGAALLVDDRCITQSVFRIDTSNNICWAVSLCCLPWYLSLCLSL